eukprot:CAMPEP_0201605862 /NCGR_PEP_ID=MMETSP0492-20130828/5525_1 /ASSEMBLY_ACC=CAM_ASM_000837 /TAXON_ID=420259 /ORGANISM="Thalassiosira gravida, Strain GMp14c1" /LENGTH=79 /DNA_ID=CAMNT_0048070181 /DNA_START=140 /DNA_END=376 /DNA_ORIENTATION=-
MTTLSNGEGLTSAIDLTSETPSNAKGLTSAAIELTDGNGKGITPAANLLLTSSWERTSFPKVDLLLRLNRRGCLINGLT